MKILFISSEVTPFAQTGGMADVSGALPSALMQLGHQVLVVMPYYRQVREGDFNLTADNEIISANVSNRPVLGTTLSGVVPGGAPIVFLDCPEFFDREGIYELTFSDDWNRLTFVERRESLAGSRYRYVQRTEGER